MNFLDFLSLLVHSRIVITLVITYFITHGIKMVVHKYRNDDWRMGSLWETGGMPSSHTSITVALTTAIAFETGPSALFIACFIFTVIIIRDSFGMRASVADQAKLLNKLSSKLDIHEKAKIVLGHTPFQVFIGALLGLVIASSVYLF